MCIRDSCEYEAFCNVETIKFGDVTGDGKIEVADAIKVLKDIVGIETCLLYTSRCRRQSE